MLKKSILVTSLLCVSTYSNAFIVVDFAQIIEGLRGNLQTLSQSASRLTAWGDQLGLSEDLSMQEMVHSAQTKITTQKAELKAQEEMHNKKVMAAAAPIEDICDIIITVPKLTECEEQAKIVSEAMDKDQHLADGAFSSRKAGEYVSEHNGSMSTHNDNADTPVNRSINRINAVSSKVDRVKTARPDLFESDSEVAAELRNDNVNNPMSLDPDLIMSPRRYLSYESSNEQQAAMDYVDHIVPTFTSNSSNAITNNAIISDMQKYLRSRIVKTSLLGLVANRTPTQDSISELRKYVRMDEVFNGGKTVATTDSIRHKVGYNPEMSADLIQRIQAVLLATEIHFMLQEYKYNLAREAIMAVQLLERVPQ
ncbi:hypothetical protein AB6D11_02935 [Vibrio splendidus]